MSINQQVLSETPEPDWTKVQEQMLIDHQAVLETPEPDRTKVQEQMPIVQQARRWMQPTIIYAIVATNKIASFKGALVSEVIMQIHIGS